MTRKLMAGLVVTCLVLSGIVIAAEAEEGKGAAVEQRKLEDLSITGKLTKVENKDGDGPEVVYVVSASTGERAVIRPESIKDTGAITALLDQNVSVVGKGFRSKSEGKKLLKFKEITKIEKAAS